MRDKETRPAFHPLNYTLMMRAGRLPNALKKRLGSPQRMHISAGLRRARPFMHLHTKLLF
jgi:hypothetical protein